MCGSDAPILLLLPAGNPLDAEAERQQRADAVQAEVDRVNAQLTATRDKARNADFTGKGSDSSLVGRSAIG